MGFSRQTLNSMKEGLFSEFLTLSFSHFYDTEDYLRYAHGLISQYISEALSKALLNHLQYVQTSNNGRS